MEAKKRASVLLACLVLSALISCATKPASLGLEGKPKASPPSKLPHDFFGYSDFRDLKIEIHSAIHERPEIPERVTYIGAESSAVDDAVAKIQEFFINGRESKLLFGEMVICGSYVANRLAMNKTFRNLDYLPMASMIGPGQSVTLRGFRTDESVNAFAYYLRNTLNGEGSFIIRKPTPAELDWYWTIIFFDIEEPVLVLESTSHRIFLDFDEGRVFFADDFAQVE